MTANNDYYAHTAYRAQIWQAQPANPPHNISGMTLLPFNDYRQVDPDIYLDRMHEVIHAPQPDEEEQKRLPFRFDAQKIRTLTPTRPFVDVFCTLGGYILLLGSVCFLIGSLLLYFF